MSKHILIDPVTRIEGHAKISIYLDDAGNVADAAFHVVEFRGFEKFCEGRPYSEMPGICGRICGICPVSHLLASAKAGDAIMAVAIPPAAEKLRRLMNLGQLIQSHALSFFHLSSPDFLLGWDTPPESRNVFGLIARPSGARPLGHPAAPVRPGDHRDARRQEDPSRLGRPGRRAQPALRQRGADRILGWLPEAFATANAALELFKRVLETHEGEVQIFGNFPSLFMGLVGPDGAWEHHGGRIRFVDAGGNVIADQLEARDYRDFIGETVHPFSYLKSPYYKPLGDREGMYRVGPLARLNVCSHIGTPRADAELKNFRSLGHGAVTSSFLYHYARLIEIIACLERVEEAIGDPQLLGGDLRADAGINQLDGVGVSEAPRGTLFHHYTVDRTGIVQRVNLIIATGQNNLAMNRTVAQIARHYLAGDRITEPLLNRVEAGIRCYDPCLSCSTHAAGRMPLHLQLIAPDGAVISEAARGE